jgi:hypothetical protein
MLQRMGGDPAVWLNIAMIPKTTAWSSLSHRGGGQEKNGPLPNNSKVSNYFAGISDQQQVIRRLLHQMLHNMTAKVRAFLII